ncbi:MAG: hypothetical protein ORN83_01295 [Chthoniobacteraceae bacterium]|nr:hypothetical protein [Chthoniobacteraceae bacterium]
MLLALYYSLAFYLTSKFFPSARTEYGAINPWIFVPITGAICGVLETVVGLIFFSYRMYMLLMTPVIYMVLGALAWWLAGLTHWTRGENGQPTPDSYMYVCIFLVIILSTAISNSKSS